MSDVASAQTIRDQMQRARALQEHINRLGAGPPDPCAKLRAAARVVVEAWDSMGFGDSFRVPEQMNDSMNALRAAVKAATEKE